MDAVLHISHIRVHNFKSFADVDVNLARFNAVVGRNGSGKSNFMAIFSFLKDVMCGGLDSAISLGGGHGLVRNFAADDPVMSMEFTFEASSQMPLGSGTHPITGGTVDCIIYGFALEFDGSGCRIIDDHLSINGRFEAVKTKETIDSISFRTDGHTVYGNLSNLQMASLTAYVRDFPPSKGELLLGYDPVMSLVPGLRRFISTMGLYRFAPTLSRFGPARSAALCDDGSNLPQVLDEIMRDPKAMSLLNVYAKDLLPVLDDILTERAADGSMAFGVRESYSARGVPPAAVSGGTAGVLALLVCLFFQRNEFTFIEGPERNMHPGLLSRMVQMMEEASESRQITITTHNTDMLNQIPRESMLLIGRDARGHSVVTRPSDHDIVGDFEGVLSVGQLVTQDLLG